MKHSGASHRCTRLSQSARHRTTHKFLEWMQAPMEMTGFPECNVETWHIYVSRLPWSGSWNGLEVLAYRFVITQTFFIVTFRKHARPQSLRLIWCDFSTLTKKPKRQQYPLNIWCTLKQPCFHPEVPVTLDQVRPPTFLTTLQCYCRVASGLWLKAKLPEPVMGNDSPPLGFAYLSVTVTVSEDQVLLLDSNK